MEHSAGPKEAGSPPARLTVGSEAQAEITLSLRTLDSLADLLERVKDLSKAPVTEQQVDFALLRTMSAKDRRIRSAGIQGHKDAISAMVRTLIGI